ncbi:M1-specific T cell receptor alpha chain-like [Hyla sarda]|uniref:M1-specific T cell receptor alpha chain-like n=1 Tax=Hyla sarda TaxID=327740 RepID=UPI0024C269D6|nr:M1-specific T cell receptor alpha chain-like [Hyla sarda]
MYLLQAAFILSLYSFCSSNIMQPSELETLEGEDFTLRCDHPSFTGAYPLLWYKLLPGRGPVLLISEYYNTKSSEKNYAIIFSDDKKYSDLKIQSVKPEESAVYLCAHSADFAGNKLIFGRGTMVTVMPKTARTTPSVYKLKSEKSEEGLPDTVCLVTDFPSPNKTLKVDDQVITLNDEAVLDKSTTDVWRYSAVLWDNDNHDKNRACKVEYDENAVSPEDETPLAVNERLQTSPGMNTLSMTVLGLRMLTVKAIIYNLIITCRLWTS